MDFTTILPYFSNTVKTINGLSYKISTAQYNLEPALMYGTSRFGINDVVDFFLDSIVRFISHNMGVKDVLQFRFILDLSYNLNDKTKKTTRVDDCFGTSFEALTCDDTFSRLDLKIVKLTELINYYISNLSDPNPVLRRFRVQIKYAKPAHAVDLNALIAHTTSMTQTIAGEKYRFSNAEYALVPDKLGSDMFDIDDIVDYFLEGMIKHILHNMAGEDKISFRFILDMSYKDGGGNPVNDCFATEFETIRRHNTFRDIDDKMEKLTDLTAEYTSTISDVHYTIKRFRLQIKKQDN